MRVTEGWKRIFIAVSAVYWLVVLLTAFDAAEATLTALAGVLIEWGFLYAVLAGLVAGVVWIIAGFRKSKPDAE